jgi:hypothetical protein
MKGIECVISSNLTDSRVAEELYGEWHESYKNKLKSIKFVNQQPDIVTSLDIQSGDRLYVVWIEYSTGDSFGYSYCGQTEGLGVFLDEKIADRFSEFIEETKDIEELFRCNRTKISLTELRDKFKSEYPQFDNVEINLKDNDKHYSDWSNSWIITYRAEDGQEIVFNTFPWSGYFERIESVNVDRMVI